MENSPEQGSDSFLTGFSKLSSDEHYNPSISSTPSSQGGNQCCNCAEELTFPLVTPCNHLYCLKCPYLFKQCVVCKRDLLIREIHPLENILIHNNTDSNNDNTNSNNDNFTHTINNTNNNNNNNANNNNTNNNNNNNNLILNMEDVACTNKQLGCAWKGALSELEHHLKEKCTFLIESCKFLQLGCNWRGLHAEVQAHELQCPVLRTPNLSADNGEQRRHRQRHREQLQNFASSQKKKRQDVIAMVNSHTLVRLTVSGTRMETPLEVLCCEPSSILAEMFQSNLQTLNRDSEGYVVINRNPNIFQGMLTFLQTHQIFIKTCNANFEFLTLTLENELKFWGFERKLEEFRVLAKHWGRDMERQTQTLRLRPDFQILESVDKFDFESSDMSGCDLSGFDLFGVDLRNSNLENLDLSYSNLTFANFGQTYPVPDSSLNSKKRRKQKPKKNSSPSLKGANLSHVDLCGRDFSGVNFSAADLSFSNLRHTNFSKAILKQANLTSCKMRGINLSGVDLTGRDFTGYDLSNSNLSYTNFMNASLKNANLNGCNMVGINLSGTDLSGRDFSGVDFTDAIFSKASLKNTNLTGCKFKGANFTGVDLSGRDFTGADFSEANFTNTNLKNTNLMGCKFKGANFTGVDLSGRDFTHCDLCDIILIDAILKNTTFNNTILTGAHIFDSAITLANQYLVFGWVGNKQLSLLYRGSRDGFGAAEFHQKCDNKGPTLTIVKDVNGNIFGGFTSVSWTSPSSEEKKTDANAFLFTLKNNRGVSPRIFKVKYPQFALRHYGAKGPLFGTCDLHLVSSANRNGNNLHCFENYDNPTGAASPLTGGERNFYVVDYEVFLVKH